jgi:hypothetical protein
MLWGQGPHLTSLDAAAVPSVLLLTVPSDKSAVGAEGKTVLAIKQLSITP